MTVYLGVLLFFLIILSAFFSGSETGMIGINRYRMRHLARANNHRAKRVLSLLKRPDRLLGLILIGNTFANILASSVATIIAIHYLGNFTGGLIATIALTFIILIFSETAPKTLAALYPQHVALGVSGILKLLLRIFYPLVWAVNTLANGVLRLCRVRLNTRQQDTLNPEELRMVVQETSGQFASHSQDLLMHALDLGDVTVKDVMVDVDDIYGIDLGAPWSTIVEQITHSEHICVPVYRKAIHHVMGVLNLARLLQTFYQGDLTREKMMFFVEEVSFVPEVMLIQQQLLNFQKYNHSLGLVVDEYGDVQGLVTIQDIVEEIVGAVTFNADLPHPLTRQSDGSYIVDARVNVRDFNRMTGWELPVQGPKTLSGLIIEELESIPVSRVGISIQGYPIEVIKVYGNTIQWARVWPR